MKKKLLSLTLVAFLILGMTGCEKNETKKEKSKVFKYMEKLEPSQTLEDINKIIGFEGILQRETEDYKVYEWELSENTSISVQFFLKYNTSTISTNYPLSMVSKKADFSKWDDIKSKLKNNEEITYDQFVKLVGGVQGVISQKSSDKVEYTWYNSDGGYLSAYFNTDGKCTMATGMF